MSTNLPAQSLLALAENDMTLLRNALMTAAARLPVLQDREEAYSALKQINAYLAARAASPRTLEEVLMIEEVRTSDEYGEIIGSDPLPCYEVCRAAEDGWHHAESQRKEHARRLAGEGGG